MRLIVIFGPPAVGKMTVGHELAKLTGLKLFHNHMTIELVLNFFNWGDPEFGRLGGALRQRIFEEVAGSQLPGMIFTYVWSLNDPKDKEYIDKLCAVFQARGAEVYFAELEATLPERIARNASEFRLLHKPSKRDVVESENRMLEHVEKHRFNTNGDFYYPDRHVKIENTNLSPTGAAKRIVEVFALNSDATI
jgi:hypothetical protein